jgi:hypothetical protein
MELVPISKVKANPANPRTIKDDKFAKLVESLKNFPEMANVRPIIVNSDMVTLGGNMRLKAMKEAGWKQVPVTVVDWPEAKQREFIIKDNVGFGDWDWDTLANEWDAEPLEDWGLDVPDWSNGHDANNMDENDLDMTEEFDPVGLSSGMQRVVFIFDGPNEAESYLKSLKVEFKKMAMAWQVNLSTQSI